MMQDAGYGIQDAALKNRRGVILHPVAVLSFLLLMLAAPPSSMSESLASKNKKGNRLFAQGKYEDAEKAYLSAQGDDPGKPEVLYNLGNSLIKQKKYQEGVQALGQSIHKGDSEIKEKGWYNTGTALFSSGNYKDSADALIQALKLNPADKDAKHNLELALMKLKEQEQKKNRKQNSKDSKQDKAENEKDSGQQKQNQSKNSPGDQHKPDQPMKPQESKSAALKDESMTRDRALQLLDAMQNQEMEEQRKLLEHRAREKANSKDW